VERSREIGTCGGLISSFICDPSPTTLGIIYTDLAIVATVCESSDFANRYAKFVISMQETKAS
jgi:hypothetical protein